MQKLLGFLKKIIKIIKEALIYLNEELWIKGTGLDEPYRLYEPRNLNLVDLVELARSDWEQAKALFEEVQEPELIDHAIYAMEAAERKYVYLLRIAREENIVDKELYNLQEKRLA
ncbi:MAG: DUF2508 family protein [Peptococcaceae bacterium]|nr:YaaL family protein [Peptococcaceae bacterium]MDH7523858.1 DUF2508 family protein [Peptococcaceae bacterium]